MADHYETEVNEGNINMTMLQRKLNKRYDDGWKVAHIFSEGGNTIIIWERYR